MKKLNRNKALLLLVLSLLLVSAGRLAAQDEETEKPEPVVHLRYYNQNNSMQYLLVESQTKTGKKTEPRPNVALRIYLDSAGTNNLVAALNTGAGGKAKAFIPPALKDAWTARPAHTFIVVEEPAKKDGEETSYNFDVAKAKITLDTASDEATKSVTVNVMKYENEAWVPANEVELKVGIERLGGILNAGSDDTYTTDSSGMVTVEFNKLNLPGNARGELVLVARVENNELYGNLQVKKTVPWGLPQVQKKDFFEQRTLWSRSSRSPVWLMLLAYSIIASVWGVLAYLVFRLALVIRIGRTRGKHASS